MVELDLLVSDFAEEVEEDEMLLLPEFPREYSLLHKQHLRNFHIQSNVLLDLSDNSFPHRLANLDVPAGQGVLVKHFVIFSEESVSVLVVYQRGIRGFKAQLTVSGN